MADMIEKELPSGAKLKFNLAPFEDARDLYQIVAEDVKGIAFNSKRELGEVLKDIALTAISSKKIESAIWKCLKRATINDLKITVETFESVESRGDYLTVCLEVAKENISPFMKSLYAEYGHLFKEIQSSPT